MNDIMEHLEIIFREVFEVPKQPEPEKKVDENLDRETDEKGE